MTGHSLEQDQLRQLNQLKKLKQIHKGIHMKTLPARFESIRQLEEFMSSPSEALVEYGNTWTEML